MESLVVGCGNVPLRSCLTMGFFRIWVAGCFVFAGCGDDDGACPSGFTAEGDICVPVVDSGVDAAEDSGGEDVGVDAESVDSGVDAALDASDDATLDAASDSGADAQADVAIDSAGDAGECAAEETLCNGLDDDCDDRIDEGNPEGGARCGTGVGACEQGTETCVAGDIVCQGGVEPTDETCNGADDDCDTRTDEGVLNTFYRDMDGDSYGTSSTCEACTAAGCSGGASLWATRPGDCDDSCAVCFPGNPEVCDEENNDCDAMTDEGVTTTYYPDTDRDTYGQSSSPMQRCSGGSGLVTRGGDCADSDNRAFPGQGEQFGTPILGARTAGTGPYDFNCDGVETQAYRRTNGCPTVNNSSCNGLRWSAATAPACGFSAAAESCLGFGGSCTSTSRSLTQLCN